MSSISPGWKPRHARSEQAQCGVARRDRNSLVARRAAAIPRVDHRMALHELPRDRGDECGHGSSQGPDQCAQAPSDCHGSTFFAAPALLGDRPTRRFYETGLGFRAAVLRRFCRNTPRPTFFIERSPRPWRCGRSPSSPRNCRNNARIRARELKPPFHGCACLAAANRSCTKETAQGGSAKRSNSTLGSSAANRAVTCWLSR